MLSVEPLLAHLDKTGLRVICGGGGNTCREELARVLVIGPAGPQWPSTIERYGQLARIVFTDPTDTLDLTERCQPGDRVLCMLTGWAATDDGRHWTLTRHAAQRAAKATAAVRRGNLDPANLDARRRPRGHHSDFKVRRFGLERETFLPLDPEGILADCPRCHRTNLLLAANLHVVSGVGSGH